MFYAASLQTGFARARLVTLAQLAQVCPYWPVLALRGSVRPSRTGAGPVAGQTGSGFGALTCGNGLRGASKVVPSVVPTAVPTVVPTPTDRVAQ